MRIFTVDAFTNQAFKGNPAGVCVLDGPLNEKEYLNIAQEINLPETAFTYPIPDGYSLRWFTPTEEVDLCGHATLATAKILFEKFNYPEEEICFDTLSGDLTVKNLGEKLEMNFPYRKMELVIMDAVLENFLGETPIYVGADRDWCMVEMETEEQIINFRPNLELLKKHPRKVFAITAKSKQKDYDFTSRVFGPAIGIDEDPVTGSAHCYLAKYWSEKLGKKILKGFQASKRSGEIECELIDNQRILLRGDCVVMSEMLVKWDKEMV
ncbi:PhzF family phenazine biosynthesis protein [Sediminitomix flava]|uniref:PhzF family phenazine biosynthesis protein n=1 Tax=Sediminitomix flava TaxID=379075 RepID=A0A315ZZF7_SEDFL|nr:PhzF family phenazine biosynthesis isomerase [Sediminitomix flava]PWJ42747.1 PhzF family phenazine biosynthesis protein [Sediminitomix flava]